MTDIKLKGLSVLKTSLFLLISRSFFIRNISIQFIYFKHIYTGYKFNKYIVLQFGPVKIKKPNKLSTNKLDKNIYI